MPQPASMPAEDATRARHGAHQGSVVGLHGIAEVVEGKYFERQEAEHDQAARRGPALPAQHAQAAEARAHGQRRKPVQPVHALHLPRESEDGAHDARDDDAAARLHERPARPLHPLSHHDAREQGEQRRERRQGAVKPVNDRRQRRFGSVGARRPRLRRVGGLRERAVSQHERNRGGHRQQHRRRLHGALSHAVQREQDDRPHRVGKRYQKRSLTQAQVAEKAQPPDKHARVRHADEKRRGGDHARVLRKPQRRDAGDAEHGGQDGQDPDSPRGSQLPRDAADNDEGEQPEAKLPKLERRTTGTRQLPEQRRGRDRHQKQPRPEKSESQHAD